MFGHFPELIILLIIGLIVFGPEKLPEIAASAGKVMGELRRAMNEVVNPEDTRIPDDFSTYYYESLRHAGEEPETMEVAPGETWHMSTAELEEDEIEAAESPVAESRVTPEHAPGPVSEVEPPASPPAD